jgi:glutaminyl-tRNA synthetase
MVYAIYVLTNPDAEEQEYVDGIANDVKWLGF